jgi:eukaryotic-like serine/threonine-protein kinase
VSQWLQLESGGWDELSRLIDTALELPAEARAQWLDSLDDNDLKKRLRTILARSARVETSDFLGALPSMRPTDAELAVLTAETEVPGECIGGYRLVRELGRGGMSAVWLAERIDGLIRRPVALKLPQGLWRRGALAERFARERDILAALNHPNIARLYDAGFGDRGQPYLAIEYVEGQALDAYCAATQPGLRERLLLFLSVARAVAYAHTQLIVHRDLKPSNILVTPTGAVRLLDFGIAKLLDPEQPGSAQTELAAQAFTPDYAAPEQIAGEPVTTATDVYSLGVLLYELISQTRPYKLARGSRASLAHAIAGADVPRPSDVAEQAPLRKELRGDLDTIVLRALKTSPSERYATVNAFADDLERYLDHRPVLARPDALGYRIAKFARRNRALVAGAGVLMIAILAGTTVSIWQARAARAEASRAAAIQEFLASTIRDADPHRGEGRVLSAADLLRQARQRADGLRERPELRIEMLTLIAASLLNLEDFDAAESAAKQALYESIRTRGPQHEQTLRARMTMVGVHRFRGRTADMRRELDLVEEILSTRSTLDPADRYFVLESRAHLAIDAGEYEQASAAAKQALTLAEKSFGERDPRTAAAAVLLAESYEYADVTQEFALQTAERAFRLTESIHGVNPRHPRLITAREVYGRSLGNAGQPEAGVRQLEITLAHAIDVYGSTSSSVGLLYSHLARYEMRIGRLHESIAHLDSAVAILGAHARHDSFTYLSPLGLRGVAHLHIRDGARALPDLDESVRGYATLFGPEHEETVIKKRYRALALAYLGRSDEARAEVAPVVELYRTRYREPLYLPGDTFIVAGIVERLAGNPDAARDLLREALDVIGPGGNADRLRADALTQLALAELDRTGADASRALAYLEEADALQGTLKQTGPRRADVLLGLGRAHLALGSNARALEFLRQADEFWQPFAANNRWAGEAGAWYARGLEAAGLHRRSREVSARARATLRTSPLPIDVNLLRSLSREERLGDSSP